jgi:hypothetical protein
MNNAKYRQKLRDHIKRAQDKLNGITVQDERSDILIDLIEIFSNDLRQSWLNKRRSQPTTKILEL